MTEAPSNPTPPPIPTDPSRILNINIGVLGHVDSGKTSLVKTLSTLLSTASLDKSSQSRQRGITLDLGFSAFMLPLPPQFPSDRYDCLQVTLVDCPGHAGLIRTIIGGAQIIDMMLLVIDATKGIQTQTAECLVIAEMTTRDLIVVLNKCDLLGEDRWKKLEKVQNKIRKTLKTTVFGDCEMIGVSAAVGGEKVAALQTTLPTENISELISVIRSSINPDRILDRRSPQHNHPRDFYFAVDHCFPIKGQGTVITGTVLSGSLSLNDSLSFPEISSEEKKVKSLQMFRRRVSRIQTGDRAGICVGGFDSKSMERGVAAYPGKVGCVESAIAVVRKVRFFKGGLRCESKVHVTVGHTTVMASVLFFGGKELKERDAEEKEFGRNKDTAGLPVLPFDFEQHFEQQHELIENLPHHHAEKQQRAEDDSIQLPTLNWAVLHFQTPVYCPMNSLVIGSRLDTDVQSHTCRLAFCGRLIQKFDPIKDTPRLKIYTHKEKIGTIIRLGDPYYLPSDNDHKTLIRFEAYGTDLFKKETNMTPFVNMKLLTDYPGEIGIIKSSFGTSGKFKAYFPAGTKAKVGDKLYLKFKRFLHDEKKVMVQDELALPEQISAVKAVEQENKDKKYPKKKDKKENNSATTSKIIATGEISSIKTNDLLLPDGTPTVAIVSGFFTLQDNIREKVGMKVLIKNKEGEGEVTGAFGKAGKCKVLFKGGVSAEVGAKVYLLY